MASKCWFVLRQTHYPPPTIIKDGLGGNSGPICLGHIIPDLKHLDNVINRRNGPLKFPPDMPISSAKCFDLTDTTEDGRGSDLSLSAGVPIAAAAGIIVRAGIGAVFKRSVRSSWTFEALETFIIQPTAEYVAESVETEEVSAYLSTRVALGSHSVFMITGIKVAKGAAFQTLKSSSKGLSGGTGVEVPLLAEAGIEEAWTKEKSASSSAEKMSDFIWAIRLAKISKGLINRQWSHETLSKGATFSLGEQQLDIGSVVVDEFSGETDGVQLYTTGNGEVFVLTD